ncbi:unnamed protein product [Periconia digitata]|uniref:Uncharacterized protein n=1 Tax=Periconia digitata TaxID=1303443 RepID=A0A9W4XSR2_9PLEO|nr:unnamed protein product [Periconia digitata]
MPTHRHYLTRHPKTTMALQSLRYKNAELGESWHETHLLWTNTCVRVFRLLRDLGVFDRTMGNDTEQCLHTDLGKILFHEREYLHKKYLWPVLRKMSNLIRNWHALNDRINADICEFEKSSRLSVTTDLVLRCSPETREICYSHLLSTSLGFDIGIYVRKCVLLPGELDPRPMTDRERVERIINPLSVHPIACREILRAAARQQKNRQNLFLKSSQHLEYKLRTDPFKLGVLTGAFFSNIVMSIKIMKRVSKGSRRLIFQLTYVGEIRKALIWISEREHRGISLSLNVTEATTEEAAKCFQFLLPAMYYLKKRRSRSIRLQVYGVDVVTGQNFNKIFQNP